MMVAVTALEVAFAAAIVTGVTGVAAPLISWMTTRATNRHERQLARDERLHDKLCLAYEELLDFLYLMKGRVAFTKPILGPTPDPPDLPPPERCRRILARASVIGSEEVTEAFEEAERRYATFQGAVMTLDGEERQPGGALRKAREDIDAARRQFYEQADALERLMRAETRA